MNATGNQSLREFPELTPLALLYASDDGLSWHLWTYIYREDPGEMLALFKGKNPDKEFAVAERTTTWKILDRA